MCIKISLRLAVTVSLVFGVSSFVLASDSRKEPGVSDLYTCRTSTLVTADERALLRLANTHVRAEGLGPLLPGERCMVKAAATGYSIWLGASANADDPANDPAQWVKLTNPSQTPQGQDEAKRIIRAPVLRWLSIDSNAQRLVDAKGIRLGGAILQGQLDLSYARVLNALTLNDSAVGPIKLRYATTRTIDLSASTIQLLDATSATVIGDILLKRQFHAAGLLDFTGAVIHGKFDCSRAILSKAPESLIMPMAHVDGSVILDGARVAGLVRLNRAAIDNALEFSSTAFTVTSDKYGKPSRKNGVEAEYVTIRGIFFWLPAPLGPATILDLTGSTVDTLWDSRKSWPQPGNLFLEGFSFSQLGTGSPSDAKSRESWLGLQPDGWITEDLTAPGLAPQLSRPAAKLADALANIGLADDAAIIRVDETERELESIRSKIGSARYWLDRLWGLVAGFGYRPLRALWGILAFVCFGWVLFFIGFRANVMTPTDKDAYAVFVGDGSEQTHPRITPPHYPMFNSLVYSLETFFPLVDLFEAKDWFPNPHARPRWLSRPLRVYLWLHVIVGWILTTTLVAGMTGLIHQ
jgi:hypothetical protein